MQPFHVRILESGVAIVIMVIVLVIIQYTFRKIGERYKFQKDRVRFTIKLFNISIYLSAFVTILFIWGVDRNELALFLSSFVAILGIALFAQWSMLSNVTASILLFISHPAKVGDTISILDKEFPLNGRIHDIGAFFMTIKTDANEVVTIPNSILFQKMIKITST
jgi:small-conductance mechanosensitive channel